MTTFVLRRLSAPGQSSVMVAGATDLVRAAIEGSLSEGPYLEWFDVDANRGRGADVWTHDMTKAMRFASFQAAMEAWKTQSKVQPLRSDGMPNRPLTAYSVTVETVADRGGDTHGKEDT